MITAPSSAAVPSQGNKFPDTECGAPCWRPQPCINISARLTVATQSSSGDWVKCSNMLYAVGKKEKEIMHNIRLGISQHISI